MSDATLIMKAAVAGLTTFVEQQMVDDPYRRFMLWGLSKENPNREQFLQMLGIPQLAALTHTLLKDYIADDQWGLAGQYQAVMSVYLTFEVFSDNVAIGLAQRAADDRTYIQRRDVLGRFNQVMVRKLNRDPRPASDFLTSVSAQARAISLFQQNLSPAKHISAAEAYVMAGHDDQYDAIEYALLETLTANINACVAVANWMDAGLIGTVLRSGLIERYQAVNRLIYDDYLDLESLIDIGTHAILVIPVLAYYASMLGEVINPNPGFKIVVVDSSLQKALYDAALLVRLLNDLGTAVVRPEQDQYRLVHRLVRNSLEQGDHATFGDLLLELTGRQDSILTRIRKDLEHGEFNIVLHQVLDMPDMEEAAAAFLNQIDACVDVYADHFASLIDNLVHIEDILDDDSISQLILRFVKFHELMYSQEYMAAGDYAN